MKQLRCVICGMDINNNNYNLNSNGFLNKNSVENIEHCPFCGVDKEFFIEAGQVFCIAQELDIKTLSILEKAMKLETFNGDFYAEAAKLAKAENIKNMFKDLSKIEYMHARIHKTIGGFKENPILNKLDYSKYNSDIMLLEMAKQREEHAISFYEKNYSQVSSNMIQKVFEGLTKVEQEHVELTNID